MKYAEQANIVLAKRLFHELQSRYGAYRDAGSGVRELVLALDGHAVKAEAQMEVLRSVWDALDEALQANQSALLHALHLTLQRAAVLAESVTAAKDRSPGGGAEVVDPIVSALRTTIEDLQGWERCFDASWFLIARCSAPAVGQRMTQIRLTPAADRRDAVLERIAGLAGARLDQDEDEEDEEEKGEAMLSVFDTAPKLKASKREILRSAATLGSTVAEGRAVIVDQRISTECGMMTDNHVQMLARALHQSDPMTWGLLRCLGVVRTVDEVQQSKTYDFVFEVPPTLSQPRGLREVLLNTSPNHWLDERLRLAKMMAKSVAFVHNVGFVHKHISPENFVVLQDGTSALVTPFLVGFANSHAAEDVPGRAGDVSWETNLYRHPDLQEIEPQERPDMQHDIYSLGVCLLEIGLWTSFLHWPEGAENPQAGPLIEVVGSVRPAIRIIGSKCVLTVSSQATATICASMHQR